MALKYYFGLSPRRSPSGKPTDQLVHTVRLPQTVRCSDPFVRSEGSDRGSVYAQRFARGTYEVPPHLTYFSLQLTLWRQPNS